MFINVNKFIVELYLNKLHYFLFLLIFSNLFAQEMVAQLTYLGYPTTTDSNTIQQTSYSESWINLYTLIIFMNIQSI